MSRAEVAKFNAQLRMAEGSLQKAGPLLNLFDSNDQLSVGFRLKTFFNSVIRDSKGGMGSVKKHYKIDLEIIMRTLYKQK